MIINPSLPFGHTVFCDDIRHEIGGKISLIGIYQGELIVREFPTKLAKLCLVITIHENISSHGKRTVRIVFEPDAIDEGDDGGDGEEKILSEMEYEVPDEAILAESEEFKMRTNRLELIASPFALDQAGKLKVRMYQDDDEVRMGALIVKEDPNHELLQPNPS